jgi:hypothetical protein
MEDLSSEALAQEDKIRLTVWSEQKNITLYRGVFFYVYCQLATPTAGLSIDL